MSHQNPTHSHGQSADAESHLESHAPGIAPPAFQLMASSTLAPVQRQEDPEADPYPLDQLPEEHRDPMANSNVAIQNIQLIIDRWQSSDEGQDDQRLAYILATTKKESWHSMQAIHESMDSGSWDDGNRADYAPAGYWGRGFVQLTWEDNYRNLSDDVETDLVTYEEAALLPTISSTVTVDGMLDGAFRPSFGPLSDFISDGTADYYGARDTVNGDKHRQYGGATQNVGNEIAGYARSFEATIAAYRADAEIQETQTLAEYLYFNNNQLRGAQIADSNRILEALGYMEFTAPSFPDATEGQENYVDDIEATGYAPRLQRINRTALAEFQRDFNASHNLETPLNEAGQLDEPTLRALLAGGNQIESGNGMIDYAFSGEVEARNLVTEAWETYQEDSNISQLAITLLSFMPTRQEAEVLALFDNLGDQAVLLALSMAENSPQHDNLAYINANILTRMSGLLRGSADPGHQAQGERVQAVIDYEPPEPDYVEYTVQSGEYLSTIASRVGMTWQELVEFNNENGNPIPNPNVIGAGARILLPADS